MSWTDQHEIIGFISSQIDSILTHLKVVVFFILLLFLKYILVCCKDTLSLRRYLYTRSTKLYYSLCIKDGYYRRVAHI